MDLLLGEGAVEVLGIGVNGYELDPFHLGVDHMVHGIETRTAAAHDPYPGKGLYFRGNALGHKGSR
jgi:hypothetical protein